jgi:4-hydroxybenzoate polyprenyltransferase
MTKLKLYWRLVRLDKPIGILLLLWPTLWALFAAADGFPEWDILVVFVLGTILMRSAGCAVNDYFDRNVDLHVKRTQERVLATGALAPREALYVAAALGLMSLALVLTTNHLTILLAGVAADKDPTALFQADRIHPKAEAHPRILANVWVVLKKML